jgi:hypothetical protein
MIKKDSNTKLFSFLEKARDVFKYKVHYIAGTNSIDKNILKGTPIFIEYSKTECGNEDCFTLFLMCRVGTDSIKQKNDVRCFKTYSDLCIALDGVDLILDIKYAREKIDKLNNEIENIEEIYKLKEEKI